MTKDNQAIPRADSRYQAYLVRFVRSDSAETWRATLEDPSTGERLQFQNEKSLLAYLADRLTISPTFLHAGEG